MCTSECMAECVSLMTQALETRTSTCRAAVGPAAPAETFEQLLEGTGASISLHKQLIRLCLTPLFPRPGKADMPRSANQTPAVPSAIAGPSAGLTLDQFLEICADEEIRVGRERVEMGRTAPSGIYPLLYRQGAAAALLGQRSRSGRRAPPSFPLLGRCSMAATSRPFGACCRHPGRSRISTAFVPTCSRRWRSTPSLGGRRTGRTCPAALGPTPLLTCPASRRNEPMEWQGVTARPLDHVHSLLLRFIGSGSSSRRAGYNRSAEAAGRPAAPAAAGNGADSPTALASISSTAALLAAASVRGRGTSGAAARSSQPASASAAAAVGEKRVRPMRATQQLKLEQKLQQKHKRPAAGPTQAEVSQARRKPPPPQLLSRAVVQAKREEEEDQEEEEENEKKENEDEEEERKASPLLPLLSEKLTSVRWTSLFATFAVFLGSDRARPLPIGLFPGRCRPSSPRWRSWARG